MCRFKGSTSCRLCARWFEGAWSRASTPGERAEIQRQMDAGHCDACHRDYCITNQPRRVTDMRDFHTWLAEAIATKAHAGQLDKADNPYIDHPRAVAAMVADLHADPETREYAIQAAWLHDVVEDTDVTLDDLAAAGFGGAVIGAVDSVTRRDGELYSALIERAADHHLGRLIKLCDNKHNTDRLGNLDEPVRSGMARRYAKARKALLEAERLRRAVPRVTS